MSNVARTLSSPKVPRTGSVRAAFGHRNFRILSIGLFTSNIGTWMQNLALPAYIDDRTRQATWVALIGFAQLGPLLLLSIPGGVLGDKFPRRPWIVTNQSCQLVLSIGIALLISQDASLWAIFAVQLGIGTCNALGAPAMQSSIPLLVARENLPGALSINSVIINGSRVLGPILAAALIGLGVTVAQLFLINAASYVFLIAAVLMITIPHVKSESNERGIQKLLTGIRIARHRTVLSRMLIGMTAFSFLCLSYVSLFPSIARLNFDIDPGGPTYKWLYATWGLGACLGGLACGTLLLRFDRRKLINIAFKGFAATMLVFAFATGPQLAIPVGFLLGFFYFMVVTPMVTIFQTNIRDHERARVMSLWFMAFGGTVTVGALAFGPVVDRVGARPVLMVGVVGALGLSWWTDLIRRPARLLVDDERGEALEPGNPAGLDQQRIAPAE